MDRVRVLQVVCAPVEVPGQPAGITGPERRAANLAPLWRPLGIDAVLAYPTRGALWTQLETVGLPLVNFELRGWKDFAASDVIEELMRLHRIDLVHSQGGLAIDLACTRAARRLGARSLVTRPVMVDDYVSRSSLARFIRRETDLRTTLRWADGVVAVSSDGFERLKRWVAPEKLHLVHNGVRQFMQPITSSQRTASERFNVGMIGHLLEYKGWDDFIRVAKLVTDWGHNVVWHIVGEGPERLSLEAMARDLGIANQVVFHGLVHDISPVLASLDLFLFTSHREGLSVAVLEAMSAGLPVVATNVGGIADQVITGENGYIVNDGDVAAAAEHVRALIVDDAHRLRQGMASQQRSCTHFSEQSMLSNYAALYQKLVR